MIMFTLGFLVGCALGLLIMAMLFVAKNSDRAMIDELERLTDGRGAR